jgi:hypothetical protein
MNFLCKKNGIKTHAFHQYVNRDVTRRYPLGRPWIQSMSSWLSWLIRHFLTHAGKWTNISYDRLHPVRSLFILTHRLESWNSKALHAKRLRQLIHLRKIIEFLTKWPKRSETDSWNQLGMVVKLQYNRGRWLGILDRHWRSAVHWPLTVYN